MSFSGEGGRFKDRSSGPFCLTSCRSNPRGSKWLGGFERTIGEIGMNTKTIRYKKKTITHGIMLLASWARQRSASASSPSVGGGKGTFAKQKRPIQLDLDITKSDGAEGSFTAAFVAAGAPGPSWIVPPRAPTEPENGPKPRGGIEKGRGRPRRVKEGQCAPMRPNCAFLASTRPCGAVASK